MNVKVIFQAMLMSMSAVLPIYSMGDDLLVIVLEKELGNGEQRPLQLEY